MTLQYVEATRAVSAFVRFERHRRTLTLASSVAAFLAQHDLSPSSRLVNRNALRSLKDGLGADVSLATLDEPGTAERLANWFTKRYEHSAQSTRVRQLAILRSACAFWRAHAWIAADPTPDSNGPECRSIAPGH